MNIRMVIFSGIMTALIGAVIGLGVSNIAQKETREKIVVVTGATLGFLIGSGFQAVKQQKTERYQDENLDNY